MQKHEENSVSAGAKESHYNRPNSCFGSSLQIIVTQERRCLSNTDLHPDLNVVGAQVELRIEPELQFNDTTVLCIIQESCYFQKARLLQISSWFHKVSPVLELSPKAEPELGKKQSCLGPTPEPKACRRVHHLRCPFQTHTLMHIEWFRF